MQCTAIFNGCKTDNFQIKICDIFLVFAWNMGWTHLGTEAFLTGAHALYFQGLSRERVKNLYHMLKTLVDQCRIYLHTKSTFKIYD